MKLSQARVAVKAIIAANMNQPNLTRRIVPILISAPGLGKSSLIAQIAEEFSIGFVDLRLAQMDPVDLRGLPVPRDGTTHYFPPIELPREGQGILLLDEFAQSMPAMLNASSQLILDKRIGDYRLPIGWHPIAASNRKSDRANAHELPTHLKTRFLHLNLEADADEWATWATANGGHPFVIGFIRYRKELIHKVNLDRQTFPSPRTWMMVSDIIAMDLQDKVVEHQMISGCVDEGAAAEFVGSLQLFRELPNARDVFKNPSKIKLPDGEKKPAILYALCGLLAREVDDTTMPALITFLDRITQDYAVATMKDVKLRNPNLIRCKAYIDWVAANHQVIL